MKKTKLERFERGLVRIVLRKAPLVTLVGTLVAIVGGYFTALLYGNLRTNIEELLPTTARSVIDLKRIGSRLKSVENLVVLAFSNDVAGSKRFVDDLAAKLDALPRTLVAGVEYKVDKERDFFKKRSALFLDYDDLVKLKAYITDKIAYEKDAAGLGLGLVEEPHFDFDAFKKKYGEKALSFDRFPDGYYATPDQTKRVVIVNLPGRAADIDAAHRLKAAVEKTIADLNPKSYAADMEIHYTGNTQNLIDEHAALIEDLKFTSIAVFVLVIASMLLYFRSVAATAALMVSVTFGTLWAMGASYFFAGYLNANSAFLASIVLGNGINFGIILLARYVEERRKGHGHVRSTAISVAHTYKATFTAAVAAGTSYGSLMLTEFRGFNQFGEIGLWGMVICWIASFTLLPAFLTVIWKWRGLEIRKATKPLIPIAEPLANFVGRNSRAVGMACLILTVGAIGAFAFHKTEVMEMDMNRLRDINSMRSGSGYYYHYIAQIFGKNLSPTVLLTDTRDEARKIAADLRARRIQEGDKSQIAFVQTLDDLIPTDQERKIALLKDFRKTLTPSTIKMTPKEYRDVAQSLADGEGLTPFTEADISPLILDKFTETDGKRGNLVLVDKPVVGKGEAENALVTINFVKELREVADKVNPNTAVAGQLPVTADMIAAILRDGPRATLFACVAVFFIILLLFRNLKVVFLVTFTLWGGVLWMGGLVMGLDIKINFLNFIALPITFGIGVDYGVNILQRYLEEGSKNIVDAIQYTGSAVGLCSLTTVIGYTSLIMAGNQAFVSFGTLAVMGELCTATVAIFYLPSFLLARQARVARRQPA